MKVWRHLFLTFYSADTDHKFWPLANFYISYLNYQECIPYFLKRKKKKDILDNMIIFFCLYEGFCVEEIKALHRGIGPSTLMSMRREGASEKIPSTCFVLFGSIFLHHVSFFVLLPDSFPTPSA